jgi:hypothetical protein
MFRKNPAIVYGCNFNNYDVVLDPLYPDPNILYILFSDQIDPKLKVWKTVITDYKEFNADPQRAARFIKTHPKELLPPHNISIWVDCCYQIQIKDYDLFIKISLNNNGIACFAHPRRNTLWEEFAECLAKNLDYSKVITGQLEKYTLEVDRNLPLYHTAVLVRKFNPEINNLNLMWYEEINNHSKRDQLSLSYVVWRKGIYMNSIPSILGINLYKSPYFKKFKHSKERNRYE